MWQSGRKKEKTGGRKPGTPNKRTQSIREMLEALGCDPIKGMARIAMDENVDIKLRAQMYRDLAPYYAPRLASAELAVQRVETYEKIPCTKQELLEALKKDPFIEWSENDFGPLAELKNRSE